jgi:hypothetical protein
MSVESEARAEAERALANYDSLYRSPRTGEYIIDSDEAQVAADLAGVVRTLLSASRREPSDCICTPAIAGISDGPNVDCPEHGEPSEAAKMLPILTDAIDRNAQDYAPEPSDTDEREWEYGAWKPWGGGAFKPAFDLGYARFMVAHDIRYKGWDVTRRRPAGPWERVEDDQWQGYCDRGSCCLELNHEGKCKQ